MVFFPCSSMIVLLLITIDFQNETFGWHIFPVPTPRVAWCGAQCLHSLRESSIFGRFLPIVESLHLRWDSKQDYISASPVPSQLISFVFCCTICIVIDSFLEENRSILTVNYVFMEEGELIVFLQCFFKPPSIYLIKVFLQCCLKPPSIYLIRFSFFFF